MSTDVEASFPHRDYAGNLQDYNSFVMRNWFLHYDFRCHAKKMDSNQVSFSRQCLKQKLISHSLSVQEDRQVQDLQLDPSNPEEKVHPV